MRVRNSIISALLFLMTTLSVILCGCADCKIKIGKYYAENSTESYIEILEHNQILFVNVDFFVLQDMLESEGCSLTASEIGEKFCQPQEYDYYEGSSIEGYDYTLQVFLCKNMNGIDICLTLRWSKLNILLCLNNDYMLAA